MQLHPSLPVNLTLTKEQSLQPFLILPRDRPGFTLLFVLATAIGWLLVGLTLRPLQNPVLPDSWQAAGVMGTFVSGLVSGLILGATQWFVLRRYLPDWLWILANSAGYVMLMTTLQAWGNLLEQRLQLPNALPWLDRLSPHVTIVVIGGMGTLLAVVCAVWLGLAQWLVLRQYTKGSWGWLLVPSIAVLLSVMVSAVPMLLPRLGLAVALNRSVLAAGILGTTQAIAFCLLRRRSGYALDPMAQFLAGAPEITRYRQVQTIARKLRLQCSQAWKAECSSALPLTYLVGADDAGAIAAYVPTNALAIAHLNQTPLPSLVAARSQETAAMSQPLARFQITFMPSGQLQIVAWLGIPLLWIGAGMVTVVMAVSAIVAIFGEHLPAFMR